MMSALTAKSRLIHPLLIRFSDLEVFLSVLERRTKRIQRPARNASRERKLSCGSSLRLCTGSLRDRAKASAAVAALAGVFPVRILLHCVEQTRNSRPPTGSPFVRGSCTRSRSQRGCRCVVQAHSFRWRTERERERETAENRESRTMQVSAGAHSSIRPVVQRTSTKPYT